MPPVYTKRATPALLLTAYRSIRVSDSVKVNEPGCTARTMDQEVGEQSHGFSTEATVVLVEHGEIDRKSTRLNSSH